MAVAYNPLGHDLPGEKSKARCLPSWVGIVVHGLLRARLRVETSKKRSFPVFWVTIPEVVSGIPGWGGFG